MPRWPLIRFAAVLLAAANSVLAHGADTGQPLTVRHDAGRLTLSAHSVPLGEVLDRIARAANLALRRPAALDTPVSIDLRESPTPLALHKLLRGHSYVLEYAAATGGGQAVPRVSAITVWPRDTGHGPMLTRPVAPDGDAAERADATADLYLMPGATASGQLSLALADADRAVREAAILALTEIGQPQTVHLLAAALGDPDPRLREDAVDALGMIGGPEAIVLLRQALADGTPYVQQAAQETLEMLETLEIQKLPGSE